MHYHPGYPPPHGYDPRTGAPVGYAPAPVGYGAPPAGYPPPAAGPPAGHAPRPHAAPINPQADSGPGAFARERPEAYSAFEQMAIHPSKEGGTEIRLPDGMCRDKHVADFLQCLKCWLWHHQGDPRVIGRPWRIRCLDLSRNGLSDASASQVLEELQRIDLRVDRLRLAGNAIEAKGLAKVTEYTWNCPDALLELDLSNNQVDADPDAGPQPGSDLISSLLRCFYNHSAYPQIVTGRTGVAQVMPLVLLMGGNRVKQPAKLLKYIEAKGGKKHVKILGSSEPYDHVGKEFLSVCLPNFLEQAVHEGRERTHKKHRSRSGRKVCLKEAPAAAPVKALEKSEKKAKKSKKAAAEEPEHWSPARSESGDRKRVAPPKADKIDKAEKSKKKRRKERPPPAADAASRSRSGSPAQDPASNAAPALNLSEAEQSALQQEVGAKLESFGGLSKEEGSRDMLSEFVVCMAVALKPPEEIHRELEAFIGDKAAGTFVKWFTLHMQHRKRA